MHLLIAARSLPFHNSGGMEVVAWDLARALKALGHSVTVMTTPGPGLRDGVQIDGVTVRCVDGPSGVYSDAWWRGSARMLADDYDGKVDVVLGVSAAANGMLAAKASLSRPPAFVFQAHGTSWGELTSKLRQKRLKSWLSASRNLYWGLIKDRVYQDYDLIVGIGDIVAGQLRAAPTRWIVGKTPVALISNGVDEQVFACNADLRAAVRKKLDVPANARLFLSVSRLHPQKGVAEGLRAFARAAAAAPDLLYAVVGDGPQEAELKALAASLGIAGRIRFTGRADRADIPGYLSAADAFLFPTRRVEGLPINILEALAAGLPIIASVGACEPSLPCQFIDRDNLEAFAEAMTQTAPPAEARASRLPDAYTLRHSAKAYANAFETLTARRTPA